MNDFFSVLDDFEFEEFSSASEDSGYVSTFSFDAADDTSKVEEAALDDIKESPKDIEADTPAEERYVWKNGDSPFSGTTAGVKANFSSSTTKNDGGAEGNLEYQEVTLNNVESLQFEGTVSEDAPLKIDDTDTAIAGESVSVSLSKGNVKGGKFLSGLSAFISLFKNYSQHFPDTYLSTDENTRIDIEGFADETPPEFTANGNDLLSITTSKDDNGTVTVTGDYKFNFDGEKVQISNVDLANPGAIVFTYNDGEVRLDASALEAAEGSVLNFSAVGGATELIVPASGEAATTVKVGKGTYEYESEGNAYFTLDGTNATGFVLADNGDSIYVEKSSGLKVYDESDTEEILVNVSTGKGYTITKNNDDSYAVTIKDSATVTLEGTATTLAFEIGSATKAAIATTGITILFDSDGVVESVQGLDLFSNDSSLAVTGPNVSGAEGGIKLLNSDGTEAGYISVSDGDFTYELGSNSRPQITVADEAIVYNAAGESDLVVGTEGGTFTNDGKTYEYTGKGYFVVEDDVVAGFAFAEAGDSIVLPTNNDITITYGGEEVVVPTVTDSDNEFTVTLGSDGKFTISDLEANANVVDKDGDEYTFTKEGAEVIFTIDGDVVGFNNYEGELVLKATQSPVTLNGETLTYTLADATKTLTAVTNGTDITKVTGLNSGDAISSTDATTDFEFTTTGGTDTFTVDGVVYTVDDDEDGVITIDGEGNVDGLDDGASLTVAPAKDVTVNGVDFEKALVDGETIYGFKTKSDDTSAFVTDAAHPIVTSATGLATLAKVAGGVNLATNELYVESALEEDQLPALDLSTVDGAATYVFDTEGNDSVKFNNDGKNFAIVDEGAKGDKVIKLGNKGDAVLVDGHDEYGSVEITGGEGHDTIIVRGNLEDETDAVLRGSMKTTIDLSAGGADKVITYAAANANIYLKNYDETSQAGVVFHDPEMPYIKRDIVEAIEDGLLVFEDGNVTAIDRGETATGIDRKTQVHVENSSSAHQTMVRLYGYKDESDSYSDDFGQLVGFTGKDGGVLDASDLNEDLVLIGNKDGKKTAGSALTTGKGNDTVFAGAGDTIDTGDGVDLIILDDDENRDAAAIIVGKGAGDAVANVKSGFNGDIFDVTSFDGKLDYEFNDGVLGIMDTSSKSTLLATTDEDGSFVKQRFVNGSDVLYAAIAEEGGTITVSDSDDTIPNYYLAKDGAIDFSAYSGYVGIDVDGEDLDYPSSVNDTSVSVGSAVNTLIGGSGTTIFKGGKGNETLVAGTGESSLYGGGGKNVLVGNTSDDKVESTEFFNIGIHNGAQNTIQNFEFIADGGKNQATFDALNLGLADGNEVTDIKVNADGSVSVAVKGAETGATEKVTIENAAGKEFLIDRGTQTETVAQIAATEVTVNNSYVDFYAATDDSAGATVKVGNIDSTEIWLGGAPIDHDKAVPEFTSSKFTVIDASGSNAEVLMAGNDLANTIIGGNGVASMWGGEGSANDVMIGGTAHNEFYYEVGNGNDTILSSIDGDVIHLGMSLDQVNFDGTEITASGISVKFNDGGTLTIDGSAEVSFSFDDGNNIKANRQENRFE